MSAIELQELAELVWQETSVLRREAHCATGSGRCPSAVAPYGHRDPSGRAVHPACESTGCLELVHELFAGTAQRLAARVGRPGDAAVEQPARYAHIVVRNAVADEVRRRRVACGLPAKPSRTDGIAGRVNEALVAGAADEAAAQWRTSLFRILRSYVCRPHRNSAHWPIDALTEEKCRQDGVLRVLAGAVARRELHADIDVVLATAAAVAGPVWVFENLTGLLARAVEPLHGDAAAREWEVTTAGPDEDVDLLPALRATFVAHRRDGLAPVPALRRAANDVYGRSPTGDDDALAALAADLDLELGIVAGERVRRSAA